MFEQLKIISVLYMIIFEAIFSSFNAVFTAGGQKLVFTDLIYIIYYIYSPDVAELTYGSSETSA